MKSGILILLGLCAIAGALQPVELEPEFEFDPVESLPDKIRAKIEEFLKKITEDFDILTAKIENIVVRLNGQIADLVSMAKGKVQAAKADVQRRLEEVRKQGGEAAACADKLEPEYHKVEEYFMNDIKACAAEARRASTEIREDVLKGIANVRNHIKDFREMLGDCLRWNPVVTIKCVKEKITEFREVIDEIINSAQAALRAAQFKSVQISSDAHVCNVNAVNAAKGRIEKINEKLSSCGKLQFLLF